MKRFVAAIVAGGMFAFAGQASAQETLTVWWGKGFYKSEDDALLAAIKKFEDKTKVKVELSQYAPQDMVPKTVSALEAGTVPDVAYGDVYDFNVTGKWAFEGKLEDLSDILVPMKDKFLPNTLETTYLQNDQAKKRAYYAFPMKQQTMHIQYWIDMLGTAGFKESDLPTGWKDYWSFWCDKVQPAYRQKTGTRIYATGFPMGVDGTDSFYSFLTFADAYNVKLVDDNGKLLAIKIETIANMGAYLSNFSSFIPTLAGTQSSPTELARITSGPKASSVESRKPANLVCGGSSFRLRRAKHARLCADSSMSPGSVGLQRRVGCTTS